MTVRPRGRGPRIWAAILAVYALLLHAPVMATMAHPGDASGMGVPEHAHHTEDLTVADAPAETGDDRHVTTNLCCVVCGGGPCAVGPVGSGSVALPLALARVRRKLLLQRPRRLTGATRSWFEARGPPLEA